MSEILDRIKKNCISKAGSVPWSSVGTGRMSKPSLLGQLEQASLTPWI